jgi:hypothetical protein
MKLDARAGRKARERERDRVLKAREREKGDRWA